MLSNFVGKEKGSNVHTREVTRPDQEGKKRLQNQILRVPEKGHRVVEH